MGPEYICLLMARYIINAHPNISVNEIELGYAIQSYIDEHIEEMFDGEKSCNEFAAAMIAKFSLLDDVGMLGATIQDFIDRVKVGEEEDAPE